MFFLIAIIVLLVLAIYLLTSQHGKDTNKRQSDIWPVVNTEYILTSSNCTSTLPYAWIRDLNIQLM